MEDGKLEEISRFITSPENLHKNPVSLLMEVGVQIREPVNFKFPDELGLSPQRMFTCEVNVGRLLPKRSGFGSSKKAAKADAAEKALELIKERVKNTEERTKTSVLTPPTTRTQDVVSPSMLRTSRGASIDSPDGLANPIGSLQELCVKNSWAVPVYDIVLEEGEAHSKQFIYQCRIQSLVSQGKGKNKKTAKKLAAESMLSIINGQYPKDSSLLGATGISPVRSPAKDYPNQLAASARPQSSPGPYHNLRAPSPVPDFLSSYLYDEPDEEVSYKETPLPNVVLDTSLADNEFYQRLKIKAEEEGLTVEYHDMPANGYSGNCLCFVRLDTTPATVCCGLGPTRSSAHNKAAQNAMLYLNTVCS